MYLIYSLAYLLSPMLILFLLRGVVSFGKLREKEPMLIFLAGTSEAYVSFFLLKGFYEGFFNLTLKHFTKELAISLFLLSILSMFVSFIIRKFFRSTEGFSKLFIHVQSALIVVVSLFAFLDELGHLSDLVIILMSLVSIITFFIIVLMNSDKDIVISRTQQTSFGRFLLKIFRIEK